MGRSMTVASIRLVWGFWFIVVLFVFGNIPAVKAGETVTVEGVWELVSANVDVSQKYIGQSVIISRRGDDYEVKAFDGSITTYSGNERRITHTFLDDLSEGSPEGGGPPIPPSVLNRKVPVNVSYTLSGDGRFLQKEGDFIQLYWEKNSGRFHHYEIEPGKVKLTFKRVSGPTKVESRGERAYQADCGKVDPNRTTPFPPDQDFCPGNLVAMTFFCGGGTGCPYVCCPKGLPYLNHCDCKCYTTSDFDCHSFSRCQEQPRQ